jgi:sugar phosphate isomerase/epimerase
MFSFYIPKGSNPEDHRNEVIDRLCEMSEFFRDLGIYMCHENEKGIYGDTPERCLDLFKTFPQLKCVFDPANFVQCEQDTKEAWAILKDYVHYLHIKDALKDGNVVPAGEGVGNIAYIIKEYANQGGNAITLEPHLKVFDGLKDLEQADEEIKVGIKSYATADEAFDVAVKALRGIM